MLVFAGRIVMAAAGLLGAAAACVILLSFAAGHRKSLHQGCHSDLSADFLDFGAGDFPFKISFEKCFKNLFFALVPRSGFGAAISHAVVNCASFYCVLQLSLCRPHCNGCVRVAWRRGCVRNIIVFCRWKS